MSIAHTWRAAKPGQLCQECRTHAREAGSTWAWAEAVWVLVIERSASGEELLCASCADFQVSRWGLSAPTISAEAAASAQTEDPAGGVNTGGVNPCTEASEQ